jgi:ABC-2 type transport system permease protein
MIAQVLSATRFALLSFRRNSAASFFTIIFPLLFLVIFGFIFGDEIIEGEGVKVATFQVPGILALAIVSATFVNLAMTAVIRREAGQLKRLRGTPVRPIVWVLGQIAAAFVIVVMMTVLVTVMGRLFFGVAFNFETIGVFALTILLGSVAFSALGLAVTALVPNENAASAITNAIVLPLYFVSDVFLITDQDGDGFINRVGDFFPIKPLAQALRQSYDPFLDGVELQWSKWAVIAIWGVVGVGLASRFFRWTPQADRR